MSESQYRFHRLPEFDYSTPGAYFITVCTNGKRNYFWESVAALTAQPLAALPPYGCGVPLAGCERHAGPGFGGTIADRTHLVGGGVLDAP